MTEKNQQRTEQAVQGLHDFLSEFFQGSRRMWMHSFFGTEFQQGRDYALTGGLIPGCA